MNLKTKLNRYFTLQQEIYDYFGYQDDWVVISIDDNAINCEWGLHLESDGGGKVTWKDKGGDIYSNLIYTQRFLPKWVYEGPEYTMVVVDTETDGNKFLQIFDNSLRNDSIEG